MIRALIVDDEAPARKKVGKLLGAAREVEVVGEASDGRECVERIRELSPDIVFLDIQMPKLDGFGVIAEIGVEEMPLTVFITAYDEHALKAFEVQAFDYLLKPFSPGRFERVLERARARLTESHDDLAMRMKQLLDLVKPGSTYLTRLQLLKDDEKEIFLPVRQIDFIRAERNYTRIHSGESEFLRRGTLNDLEGRLDPDKFLRINRSEIVRLDAVKELSPWFHGDYRVILHNGRTLTWSRRYRAKSKGAFE